MSLSPCVGGGTFGFARELGLDPGRRADCAQLILEGHDVLPLQLEPGLVELHVEERDLTIRCELPGAGRERARDLRGILRVLGDRVLSGVPGDEHLP